MPALLSPFPRKVQKSGRPGPPGRWALGGPHSWAQVVPQGRSGASLLGICVPRHGYLRMGVWPPLLPTRSLSCVEEGGGHSRSEPQTPGSSVAQAPHVSGAGGGPGSEGAAGARGFPVVLSRPCKRVQVGVSPVSRCSLSCSRNPAFRGLRRGTLSAACLPAPSAHCAPWSRHRFCCAPGPARRSRSPGPRGSAVCDRPAWTSPCDPACPRPCHLSRGRLPAVQIWGRAPKRQRSPSSLPTQPLWASAVDATGQTQALTPGRWFTLPVP